MEQRFRRCTATKLAEQCYRKQILQAARPSPKREQIMFIPLIVALLQASVGTGAKLKNFLPERYRRQSPTKDPKDG
jgi:hypothetical protein